MAQTRTLHGVRVFFFFQAEDGIRDLVRSRGLGDVYKRQIVMPAQCMRELGGQVNTFANFSDAAQRSGVYTATDYVNIMKSLLNDWKIESMVGLKENGEKARDYLMKLPDRLTKISERMVIPERELKFSWIIS